MRWVTEVKSRCPRASRRAPTSPARAAREPPRPRAGRPSPGRTGAAGRSRTPPAPPPRAASGPQRPVDPADLEHVDHVRAELHGTADRDRVHDAAVDVVLVADGAGGSKPGTAALATTASTSGPGEPVLGGPLDAGGAHLEPDRQVLEGRVAELLESRRRIGDGGVQVGAGRIAAGPCARPSRRTPPCRRPSTPQTVSRSMTAGDGSRATIAPLSAPTEVPSTRSGRMPRSNSARSMPDLDRAEHATAAEDERGGHRIRPVRR